MPFSVSDFKQDIATSIHRHFPSHETTILDVGPGAGTYADLLPEYRAMDAVEIHEPYIERYGLRSKYRRVYLADIRTFTFERYDLIILGDVLEHLTIEDAQRLLERIRDRCQQFVICVPWLSEQGVCYDNPHEEHLQNDLTHELFCFRYPGLRCLARNDRIGVYFKGEPAADLGSASP